MLKSWYVTFEVHVPRPDKESTKKGEMSAGVVENILAENTDVESLVYSKVCGTPMDNTYRG